MTRMVRFLESGRVAAAILALVGSVACAATGAVPRPFPVPEGAGARTLPGSPLTTQPAHAVAETALALLGVPYRSGGSDPTGFDCSGLVWYVFSRHGVSLPRTVEEQFRTGRPVPPEALAPGDLVFFRTASRGASHVGLVTGAGRFIHAPAERGEVRVEAIAADYWARRFVGARRVR